ncbi:hypothetical protein [Vibrio parahaemolyticus]|uniref:hypothetical protein n=1 Tax=Vibrio parahaemolyticus TaxID=670 RepID=UPI001869FCB3|nr:hypothetical protein [Vibrio parahaemolyticus]MBE4233827.1 hypothetical protein [Vibrio parahaemolyticus]MCG0011789.1 hypothetical protein [Vibrio parahaemolyticus]MCX8827934.1 hypothetical protein [Vibrio parahaemolyticus]MCX8928684.1 hypothetical protein [Vibrio parahaemolyticus]MDL1997204.1 hypothetical protein [Vibrio parahaemolyticus]
MSELCLKTTVETCMDIQYYFRIQWLGGAMLLKNENELQQALDIIIDGIAVANAKPEMIAMGVKMMNMVLANYQGEIDEKKRQAIQSIIQMAAEVDSPVFSL